MRIISGSARGTKLYTLEGIETRPTLDRVKESIFNIIQDRIYDSNVLDLFSGSGAIGLEFASRGAKKVILNDSSKKAIEIIRKNIEKTHCEKKVKIYNLDFKDVLLKEKDNRFDIIYLDPPYKTNYIKDAIELIQKLKILNNGGIIIAETDEPDRIEQQLKGLDIKEINKRKYGRASLFFITQSYKA